MKTTTIITNAFTGYAKTITTTGLPSVATIKKHVRASKACDCRSITVITINDVGYDLYDNQLIKNGK